MQLHRKMSPFWRNILFPSSGLKYWHLPINLQCAKTQNIITTAALHSNPILEPANAGTCLILSAYYNLQALLNEKNVYSKQRVLHLQATFLNPDLKSPEPTFSYLRWIHFNGPDISVTYVRRLMQVKSKKLITTTDHISARTVVKWISK